MRIFIALICFVLNWPVAAFAQQSDGEPLPQRPLFELCVFSTQSPKLDGKGGDATCAYSPDLTRTISAARPLSSPILGRSATAGEGDTVYYEDFVGVLRWAVLDADLSIEKAGVFASNGVGDKFEAASLKGDPFYCRVDIRELTQEERSKMKVFFTPLGIPIFESLCLGDQDRDNVFDVAYYRPFGKTKMKKIKIEPTPYQIDEETVVLTDLTRFRFDRPMTPDDFAPFSKSIVLDEIGENEVLFSVSVSGRSAAIVAVPLIAGGGAMTFDGLTMNIRRVAEDQIAYEVTSAFSPWLEFK